MSRKHLFRAAGAGCFLAFLACSSSNSGGFPDGGTAGTSSGSGGSSGGSGASSGGSGSGSGSSGGSGSGSGSSSSGTGSGSGGGGIAGCSSSSPTGAISLDDTTCSWTGGCAGNQNTPAKNTAVLAAASASYANKLNPTCSVCPTSPTADEPTGCPMYTSPAPAPGPGSFPGVGFDPTYDLGANQNQPVYIPSDVIIPTLDDAPDGADANTGPAGNDGYTPGEWTISDLAFLDSIGFKMDFFMNDNNWVTVTTNPADGTCDPDGYDAYVDILTHHFPANHTADHVQMGGNNDLEATSCFLYAPTQAQCCDCALCAPPNVPTAVTCTDEITSVENLVAGISNNGRPHLTRYRYPYGYPLQNMEDPTALADVQPIVAKFAVQVAWNFLTDDADNSPCGCQQATGTTCTCIDESKGDVCSTDETSTPGPYDSVNADYNNFVTAIGSGPGKGTSWGIALMHATNPWTAGTIRKLFGPGGYVSTTKYRVGSVEDAICWKYGMHSWDIVNKVNGYTGTDARGPN